MKKTALFKLSLSMIAFGTIGLFVKFIPEPSGLIAMVRGYVGALFLSLFMLFTKRKPDIKKLRGNLFLLVLSGAFIGFNWILLFESYSYTSVAVSTMCYYMAPIFAIIMSVIFFKERLVAKRIASVGAALVGMLLVSLDFDSGDSGSGITGILLALGAAMLYASVTVLNKRLSGIDSFDRTVVQLFSAALVITPYTLICESQSYTAPDLRAFLLLLLVGVLHTGISYVLFFGSVGTLPMQSVALMSYIDPVVAVVLSVLVLRQNVGWWVYIGALIIIVASLFCTLSEDSAKSSLGEKHTPSQDKE